MAANRFLYTWNECINGNTNAAIEIKFVEDCDGVFSPDRPWEKTRVSRDTKMNYIANEMLSLLMTAMSGFLRRMDSSCTKR